MYLVLLDALSPSQHSQIESLKAKRDQEVAILQRGPRYLWNCDGQTAPAVLLQTFDITEPHIYIYIIYQYQYQYGHMHRTDIDVAVDIDVHIGGDIDVNADICRYRHRYRYRY